MVGTSGWTRRIAVTLGAALIIGVLATVVPTAPSGGSPAGPPAKGRAVVGSAIADGTSIPVRDMPAAPAHPQGPPTMALAHRPGTVPTGTPLVSDPVRQSANFATVAAASTGASFEGTNNLDGVIPPDTNGAVGPNDYVELVNMHLRVYSKATGQPRAAAVESSAMWAAFASFTGSFAQLCNTNPGGDGTVLYDRAADRWLFSELAFKSSPFFGPQGPFVECFAVSTTGDPTGTYHVYAFDASDSQLPDYPKIGIWGNSYYMSANMFASNSATSSLPEVWAFDRSAMINHTGTYLDVTYAGSVPSTYNTILPADVDGATQPPARTPEIFAGLNFDPNQTQQTMGFWTFDQPDWTSSTTAQAANFGLLTNVTVAPYSTLCGGSQTCLPQLNSTQLLDAISDRVMYRLAYRNFGDHEALVVNHSVNAATTGTQAGVRWYEFDRALDASGQPSGAFFIPQQNGVAQQGTYAGQDQTTSRWMGSVAMDGAGNMALGFSETSASMDPSIHFTGRLKNDTFGQMTVTEGTIQAGGGPQASYDRWGDYTRMAIDPVDDCTFWYVGEYYPANPAAAYDWQTRIGSFTLPGCGVAPQPDFSLSASPANQTVMQGGSTTYGVTVTPSNGYAGTVALSVSGCPTGATCTLSQSSVSGGSGSSILNVATTSSTPATSSPITITGTDGALSHSTSVTLVVNAPPQPDFSLSASPSTVQVARGRSTTYQVTVTPSNGFTGNVNLSVGTTCPTNATCSFSPSSVSGGSGSSILTVATTKSTSVGTRTITITGASGSLSHSTPVSLKVTK